MTSAVLENLLTRDGASERWHSRDDYRREPDLRSTSLADQLRLQTAAIASAIPDRLRATIETRIGELRRTRVTDLAMRGGQRLPRYALGVSRLNESLLRGPAVVSFFMGDWSPYCALAFRAMDAWKDEFERFDARVLSVFPASTTHDTNDSTEIDDCSVIIDRNDRLATRLGVRARFSRDIAAIFNGLNFDVPAAALQDDLLLPLPATFVIDQQRVIRYAFVDADFRKRAEPSDVADVLASL